MLSGMWSLAMVIASFTKDRRYKVELRSPDNKVVSSKWKKQLHGTLQGSVLGPLLWNLFFDPLLDELSSIPSTLDTLELAFADDLTLVAT